MTYLRLFYCPVYSAIPVIDAILLPKPSHGMKGFREATRSAKTEIPATDPDNCFYTTYYSTSLT